MSDNECESIVVYDLAETILILTYCPLFGCEGNNRVPDRRFVYWQFLKSTRSKVTRTCQILSRDLLPINEIFFVSGRRIKLVNIQSVWRLSNNLMLILSFTKEKIRFFGLK